MKKTLLLPLLWIVALWSMNLVGQSTSPAKGGNPAFHEARFKVFDYSTKAPIAYAGLYDHSDRELGQTDLNGLLILSLPASSADIYVIRYPGFNPLNIRLTHADKQTADYEVFLKPKATEGMQAEDPETTKAGEATAEPELVKVYVKQEPTTYKKAKQAGPGEVEFAVQLSATSRPISDKKSLKSWEDIGPVFIHTENGLYKVRIGPYNTQEDAKQVLLAVKSRGKSDAFIVVQKGFENHTPFEFENHPAAETSTTPAPAKAPVKGKDEVQGVYKVRLASYLHPGGFNTKDIDMYGPLESYRKGEWTIMLIGGFSTETDARAVRDKVVAKGYPDAAVVVDRDGLLEEVK